ncbi:MAG: glycosyltransferase [Rubellimicrobium sp.]|nr:glycosyltransferase [Rubellimicrobium sp.]
MRIVHVLTRLLRAGSEENTVETCRWQAQAGHRVTLLHGAEVDPWWQAHPIPGVEVLPCPDLVHPLSPSADARAIRQLRAAYRHLCPDVIHTHQSKAGVLGRLAADAVPGAMVVHGIHIVPFDGVKRWRRALYLAAEGLAARRTDRFIAVSDAAARAYLAAGLARPEQIVTIRSGMPLERFRQALPPPDWRALLGVGEGARPPVALMMAAFEGRKQHLAFLRAFAERADHPPGLRLILAGAGPAEAAIRAAVTDLDLTDRVILTGHRNDPEALFALADVTVLASIREGLPRIVVQSLAAGVPVVACDLPALGEVLRHGENGLIAPPGDPLAACTMLCALLNAPDMRARLARGARETDLADWSLAALGPRTTELYATPLEMAA